MPTLLDHPHESIVTVQKNQAGSRIRHGRGRKRERGDEMMFSIEARKDSRGRLIILGKASRKRATTFVNIPVSAELRKRLDERIIGSMAMGTGALLQWALDELDRQGISVEARPKG